MLQSQSALKKPGSHFGYAHRYGVLVHPWGWEMGYDCVIKDCGFVQTYKQQNMVVQAK